jgi:putative DNA methylase
VTKKLIEVALPLEAINAACMREKSIRHGHPSTLHLWWARRPLAACRAVLFASLVDDPSSDLDRFPTLKGQEDERRRLFGIIEDLVKWENSTNEKVLNAARAEILRSTSGNPPPVFDPFSGGGSIPLEAQRLGLTAFASDLNPVAVLITKALIEIPPRFANMAPVHADALRGVGGTGTWSGAAGLAEDVRRYGGWMREEAAGRIGHVYPPVRLTKEQGGGHATVIAWLWARTAKCPNPACGAKMPLIRSFEISTKKGGETWVEPIVDRTAKTVRFEVRTGRGSMPAAPKVGRGASFNCLVCGQLAVEDYVRAESRDGRLNAQLVAMVVDGRRSRAYVSPTAEHERIALSTPRPDGVLTEEMNRDSPNLVSGRGYGFYQWRDLFTSRQLAVLTTFSDLVEEARSRVLRDATVAGIAEPAPYADAIATYLAFAVNKTVDGSSTVCRWMVQRDSLFSTFSRQALPMTWDYAEINTLADCTRSLSESVAWTAESVAGLQTSPSMGKGSATQADARTESTLVDVLVSTDPPYYDNVAYADLADYFYLWLRRSLSSVYPDLFRTLMTPKADELVATAYRHGGDKKKAEREFESGLRDVFARIRTAASPLVPVTVYYAFKQAETEDDGGTSSMASTGWETMLAALLGSGLSIDGTWPIRTERNARSNSIDTNALASSIVLVCRPRAVDAGMTDRRGFLAALKADLPEALRTLQHGNIAPVDLAQAAIGPGMAVYSRYSKVVEPDGQAMSVRTALGIINTVLGDVLAEQEDEFDADTRWAVTWFEQYRHEPAGYDRATVLARARGVGMNGLEAAGIVISKAGKTRLLPRAELDPAWDPLTDTRITVWEVTQHLIRVLSLDGEAAAADLVRRVGGLADTARDLAYRLYSICERKKWADEALGYNALVMAWPEITRLAASTPGREAPQQTQLFS